MDKGLPIEGAPLDRRVLLWHDGVFKVWHIGWFNHADQQWELQEAFKDKREPYAAPTHWYPMPGDELHPVFTLRELIRQIWCEGLLDGFKHTSLRLQAQAAIADQMQDMKAIAQAKKDKGHG